MDSIISLEMQEGTAGRAFRWLTPVGANMAGKWMAASLSFRLYPAWLLFAMLAIALHASCEAADRLALLEGVARSKYLSEEEKECLTRLIKHLEPDEAARVMKDVGILGGSPILSLEFHLQRYVEGKLRDDVHVFGQRILRKIPVHMPILIVVSDREGAIRWWKHGPTGVVSSVSLVKKENLELHLAVETTAVHRIGAPKEFRLYALANGDVLPVETAPEDSRAQ